MESVVQAKASFETEVEPSSITPEAPKTPNASDVIARRRAAPAAMPIIDSWPIDSFFGLHTVGMPYILCEHRHGVY